MGQKDEWAIKIEDARYGYMTFKKSDANKAVFATGNPYINLPLEDFNQLSSQWQEKSADVICKDNKCYIEQICENIAHEIGPFKV